MKGYFPLPESCWIEHDDTPLEHSFDAFLAKHNSDEAEPIIDAEMTESAPCKKHRDFDSYGFSIIQKD